MPGVNILVQVAPDLIHQFFLGMVKALHEALMDEISGDEDKIRQLDELFREAPRWKDLPHFSQGVSHLSYVTGKEMKSILFHFPYVLYSLNPKNKSLLPLSLHLLEWYLAATVGEYTV